MVGLLIIILLICIYLFVNRNKSDQKTSNKTLNQELNNIEDKVISEDTIDTPNEKLDNQLINTYKNLGSSSTEAFQDIETNNEIVETVLEEPILLCPSCLERNECPQVYNIKKGCSFYRCGGSYKPEYWPTEMTGPYGKGRFKN